MPTCIFYIDEAGSPDPLRTPLIKGDTPIFSLVGLALPLWEWRSRDRIYLSMKKKFFPDLLARTIKRPEEWEAKGSDLTKPHNANSKRRHAFLREVLNFISSNQGCCFGATFIKNPYKPTDSNSLYTHALQILVERFSLFLAEHPVYSEGIMICDSRMKGLSGSDITVARSHMSYIFGNDTGKRFINIIEAPLFADSRLTVGLQLADIIASVIYTNKCNYHLKPHECLEDYSHMEKYWTSIDQLQFKSKKPFDGYLCYGCRDVDLRRD
jgi:hypothetical protein